MFSKYLITSSGYSLSLLDSEYNELDNNLDNMNSIQGSYLSDLREMEQDAIDDGDEDRLSEINQLKELYKRMDWMNIATWLSLMKILILILINGISSICNFATILKLLENMFWK